MAYSLEYYKRKLQIQNSEIRNRKRKNQIIKQQVDELQRAYDKMKTIKSYAMPNANQIKKDVKLDSIAPGVAWRGHYKKSFDNVVKNDVKRASNDFYKSIDTMLDQIGTALSRKKGEYDTGIGALNALNRSKNWLEGVIRNWTN